MRILIAVHGYPPVATGGAEREAARAARRLAQRGHAVSVLCTDDVSAEHADLRFSDAVEDAVHVRRMRLNLSAGGDAFRWGYDNPLVERALEAFIAERQPEVLHLFSGYLMSGSVIRAAKRAGIPVVVSLMDYWWMCHRITLVRTNGERCDGPDLHECLRCQAEIYRRYRLPARWMPPVANGFWALAKRSKRMADALGLQQQVARVETLSALLQQADRIIAPSRYLASLYQQFGIAPERMLIWRQGVDIDRCLLRTPVAELRVGYLGQVKPHKGVHILLEAWGRLRGPRPRSLVLYGSDRGDEGYGRRIREQIDQLQGARWAGAFSGDEVWGILANLDVVVVPSRWVENSPNTILEAQAMGVPVVGTNLGGTAELVQHEVNGLVFAVDDAADLALQLQRLLDEPDLLQRLRLATTTFRTVDDDVTRIEGLFASLISGRGQDTETQPDASAQGATADVPAAVTV
ncbi:MAG: glycosyl transferase family 1 [Chloroflexi bacterium]|nr:MAG: glycosyl transferase family 1 [Chloroflexota bacterium]